MSAITTSVFELYKIGPGPSSSHTLGPMVAAREFMDEAARVLPPSVLAAARGVEVRLFGSLSATGRGHGTVRAILAGLVGHRPNLCPPDVLDRLDLSPSARHTTQLAGRPISLGADCVVFDAVEHARPYANTLLFHLLGQDRAVLFEREYGSIGGGFIECSGKPAEPRPEPPHAYASMAGLMELVHGRGLTLPTLMIENEMALTGRDRAGIEQDLDAVVRAMEDAVERGLQASGPLPGTLGLHRKAPVLFARYKADPAGPDGPILGLCACAFAAAEENASGRVIVTAPTSGSSGVMAGALYVAKNLRPMAGIFRQNLREGLLTAAAVGFLAKHNASLSGAEVGCQGEIGVASAMTAAFLCQVRGFSLEVAENAAETALEHHLGLTCDPVEGYVQIPCIERNAMGAVKAYAAFQIAAAETPSHHLVGLDEAIRAMAETGRDMCAKYKETSLGGLAASLRC